jgi:uncharacterized membrane protein YcaP (DUF421 family)
MEQTIDIFDWQRMLIGDEPPLFLLEIVVRTVIIYIYSLLLLRWLGSRTIGQLSTVEFLLVIALGSAVGDAMFYPDVPLLHALLVVTVVVLANKGLDILIVKSKRAERAIDGVPQEAVRDGKLCKGFLNSTSLGTSELFQQLRHNGVEQLGQVAHAYIESGGALTVFRANGQPRPGLPIVPPWEIEPPTELRATDLVDSDTHLACLRCGNTVKFASAAAPGLCPNCAHDLWTPAVPIRHPGKTGRRASGHDVPQLHER